MKLFKIIATMLLAFLFIYYFCETYLVIKHYDDRGVCIEKNVIGDKHGSANYDIIFKFDNGTITHENVGVESYVNYRVGTTYLFPREEIMWKK